MTIDDLLNTQGSLTAYLERYFGQKILVRVLFCGLKPLNFTQKKALSLPVHKPALAYVREVVLIINNKPFVQATSVIPLNSLKGDATRLRYLGTTPIGYVLFKKTKRVPFVRTINKDKQSRTSIYNWQGRKLLITEVFL